MRLAPIALVRELIQTAGGGTQNRPKETWLMGKLEGWWAGWSRNNLLVTEPCLFCRILNE